jgi:type 2A phosphatase activator TIP41
MQAAPAVPEHTLSESPNTRAIAVHGWAFSASTNPISKAPECDALHDALALPLPEMTFGNNVLSLVHAPSGWKYDSDARGALAAVVNGALGPGDGGVKVGHSAAWLSSRCVRAAVATVVL